MKTVIIFEETGSFVQFFAIDADVTYLDTVYINDTKADANDQAELSKLLFEDNGKYRIRPLDKFPTHLVREGAAVIVAGVL